MGSDVSVVLHPDASVPEVVVSTQQKAPPTQGTQATVVEHCPAIRFLESQAARELAGDSSAASTTLSAYPHSSDQPILLIHSCADLNAFAKSCTYVPILRAINAYVNRHEQADGAAVKGKYGVRVNRAGSTGSHPVCPVGLIFDPSLAVGGRLNSSEARAACVQYLKLFFVHLVAALEFVGEPDSAVHTRWPSSPDVQALQETSPGAATSAAAVAPRLSVLYLDLRNSNFDDDAVKWFVSTVIMRAVRRARPFMLVAARGNAGGVSNGAGNHTFLNYYSPDVKADMMWASLQHVLLTANDCITENGAKAVLQEFLAENATRGVLLQQQGINPQAQGAQDAAAALTCGRLSPRPDVQLLQQLYLVDILRKSQEATEGTTIHGRADCPSASLCLKYTPSEANGEVAPSTSAPTVVSSTLPSPQLLSPQPTVRTTSPIPALGPHLPASVAVVAATGTSIPPKPSTEASRSRLKPNRDATRVQQPAVVVEEAPRPRQSQPAAAKRAATPPPRQELQDVVAQFPWQHELHRQQQPKMQPLHNDFSEAPVPYKDSEESQEVPEQSATPPVSHPSPSHTYDTDRKLSSQNVSHRTEVTADGPVPPPSRVMLTSPNMSTTSPLRRMPELSQMPSELQASAQPQPSVQFTAPVAPMPAERRTGPHCNRTSTPKQSPQQTFYPEKQIPLTAATTPLPAAVLHYPHSKEEDVPVEPSSKAAIAHRSTPTSPQEQQPEMQSLLTAAVKGRTESTPFSPHSLQQQKSPATKPTASARENKAPQPTAAARPATLTKAQAAALIPQARKQQQQVNPPPQLQPRLSQNPVHTRPRTTPTPPRPSRHNPKGLPHVSAITPHSSRDPSPSMNPRLSRAVPHAVGLDDVPDVVVSGRSAHRPRGKSAQPNRHGHLLNTNRNSSPAVFARTSHKEGERKEDNVLIPSPANHRYFHSAVRPCRIKVWHVQPTVAMQEKEEEDWMRSHHRASAPRIVPPHAALLERHPSYVKEYEEDKCEEEKLEESVADLCGQSSTHDERSWIEHGGSSSMRSTSAAPAVHQRDILSIRRSLVSPRSARGRRTFDIPALGPPEPQYATSASHVSQIMREEGVRKQYQSLAQAMSARDRKKGSEETSSNPVSPCAPRIPRDSARFNDDCRPRTDPHNPRTVSNSRAAAAVTSNGAHQPAQRSLHQRNVAEEKRCALLHVEGDVQSMHGESQLSPPIGRNSNGGVGCSGGSSSPAPYRPNVINSPSSLYTPKGKKAGSFTATTPRPNGVKPIHRRLSTAEPPHIAPRATTTSQLRKVTSQRHRRVSEVEIETNNFYAYNAIPRRDFQGTTAMAAMALRQPTREELAAVQMEQQKTTDRRLSVGVNNNCNNVNSGQRRGSAAEMNEYDGNSMKHDMNKPTMKARFHSPGALNPSALSSLPQQRWTPAYDDGGQNGQERGNAGDRDETNSAPSLSLWGTADYHVFSPRPAEGYKILPDSTTVEVNGHGVALVHQALRTQPQTH